MRQADVPLVAAMEDRSYAFPWTAGIFRDCLGAGYACWVAESTEGLMGYGVLSVGADEAHLLNLCVDPAWQGHGLGRRLLRRMIDLARWHMADRVFLEVRYYPAKDGREDAIVMALDLVAPGSAPPA